MRYGIRLCLVVVFAILWLCCKLSPDHKKREGKHPWHSACNFVWKTMRMKKNMITAGIAVAGASVGLAAWLIMKKRRSANKSVQKENMPTHHLTSIFSRAKAHANGNPAIQQL